MAFVKTQEQNSALSQMNITPLVDVMLVLLVIFMIATPLMSSKIRVALPETDRQIQEAHMPSPRVTVSVTEDGRLFFNDEPVSHELLDARLAVEAQKMPQPDVNIRGDKTTQYRHINEVIDIAQTRGIRSIGFVSIKERH